MSKTCGPMYLDALEKYTGGDPAKVRLFAAGFISGQAEKVFLGACGAAMFRPSEAYAPMVRAIVIDCATRYDLLWTQEGAEIWIVRNAALLRTLVCCLERYPENSTEWHMVRGQLCGVPDSELDYEFHLREGYGKPCDRKETSP